MSKRKVIYSPTINSRYKGCRICVSKCRQNVLDIVNDEYRSYACSEHPEACAGCGKCQHAYWGIERHFIRQTSNSPSLPQSLTDILPSQFRLISGQFLYYKLK